MIAMSLTLITLCSYGQDHGPAVAPLSLRTVMEPSPTTLNHNLGSQQNSQVPATASHGDLDEGRYRNHQLYSEGPSADGLYHCPFRKDDPSCPHRATKLKCNYEYDRSNPRYDAEPQADLPMYL